jgi:hypothetical protein
MSTPDLYETDFYGWTQKQARLLRDGNWELLDINNLVEEIESLGKQQRSELVNRLSILLGHLLKWQYQNEGRSKSWFATIREQRERIIEHIDENPSLKPYISEAIAKGYRSGRNLAVGETPLNYQDLPDACPYSIEQIIDTEFFPEESGQAILSQHFWET